MLRYFQIPFLAFIILGSTILKVVSQNPPPKYINGFVVPSNLPTISPSEDKSGEEGKIFISNWTGTAYVMIFETDGTPYFYQKTENTSIDFKVNSNGILSRNIRGDNGYFAMMDSNYNYIDSIQPKNEYGLDHHDFQITPEGTYLIMPLENKNFDISGIVTGGGTNVQFRGNHIQEIDQDGNLLFEWKCWDHFDLTDTYRDLSNVSFVDFTHMNSVGVDFDGNLIISCRSLDECTKINRNTGEIIWRLGGKNNQFNFINEDTLFRIQHDFRAVPGHPNHYTLFDNNIPRAVEYYLNTVNMTAEKVWEYRSPERSSPGMGNAQRLPNGNTFINWAYGSLPKSTEVTPAGEIVYEISQDFESYRTFRFDWEGVMDEPYLITEKYPTYIRSIYHKFGDTLVDHYNIYLSTSPIINTFYTSTDSCWYDIELNALNSYTKYYIKITAVNTLGEESDFSNSYSFTTGLTEADDVAIRGKTKETEIYDPEWVPAFLGNGFEFDGIDDLVNCNNSSSIQFENKDITLEAYIKLDTLTNEPVEKNIINKEDNSSGFKLYAGENGALAFYIGDGSSWYGINTADSVLTTKEWHHVSATFDGEEMNIYVDGILQSSDNIPVSIGGSSEPLYIGSSNLHPSNSFKGSIDEVRIWNITRTQEQLTEYMSSELECKDTGLVAYWRFNEGVGQVTANFIYENNQILNSDFSNELNDWIFNSVGATANVTDQGLVININNAGDNIESTQLIQNHIEVIEDITYELSFTAIAQEDRYIEVKIQQYIPPYNDYSKIGLVQISDEPEKYSFDFTMEDPSDFDASLIINMGNETANMAINDISFGPKIDNIPKCTHIDTTHSVNIQPVTVKVLKVNFYPSPVNSVGILRITSEKDISVSYAIFDFTGKKVEEMSDIITINGEISVPVDCSSFPDGVYFIKIFTHHFSGNSEIAPVIKFIKN